MSIEDEIDKLLTDTVRIELKGGPADGAFVECVPGSQGFDLWTGPIGRPRVASYKRRTWYRNGEHVPVFLFDRIYEPS